MSTNSRSSSIRKIQAVELKATPLHEHEHLHLMRTGIAAKHEAVLQASGRRQTHTREFRAQAAQLRREVHTQQAEVMRQ